MMLSENEIKQLALQIVSDKEKVDKLTNRLNKNKDILYGYMKTNKKKSIEIDADDNDDQADVKFIVTRCERLTVDYIPEKLREAVGEDLYSEVIQKLYSINDFEGLAKVLKNLGVKPKEIKKYISSSEVVLKDKIKQLFEVGEITADMLEGTYNAKVSKSVKVTRGK